MKDLKWFGMRCSGCVEDFNNILNIDLKGVKLLNKTHFHYNASVE